MHGQNTTLISMLGRPLVATVALHWFDHDLMLERGFYAA